MGLSDEFKGTSNCLYHPENIVAGTCYYCHKEYCEECLIPIFSSGNYYCSDEVCSEAYTQEIDDGIYDAEIYDDVIDNSSDTLSQMKGICIFCEKEYSTDLLFPIGDSGEFHCTVPACFEKGEVALERYFNNKKSQLHKEAEELLCNHDINEYMSKYLSGKDQDFKIVVHHIVEREDIFNRILLEVPSSLFVSLQSSYSKRLENSSDIDSQLQIEGLIDHTIELAKDIVMFTQVFDKRGIALSSYQLLFAMHYLIDQEITSKFKPMLDPAYNVIYKKGITDKQSIVKEFLLLQESTDGNEFMIKKLLDKFNLPCTDDEIFELVDECKNQIELEEFEKNLGVKSEKKIAINFDELDGYQFENYAHNLFKLLGYASITTKLSNDQGADLIVSKNNVKTVVQCKCYKDPISNKAIQEVVAAKHHYECDEAIVLCTSSFTKSAIELAKSNKVDLWDREKLKQAITEVNKEPKKESRFHSEQTSKIMSGPEGISIPSSCPYCNDEFILNAPDIPNKNKKVNLPCPNCEAELGISLPDSNYECDKCKLSFDTIKDKIFHEDSCKTVD